MGIAATLCLVVHVLGAHLTGRRRKAALLATALFTLPLMWARSDWKIKVHAATRQRTLRILAEIDGAIAAVPAGETVYVNNRPFGPALFPELFGGIVSIYAIFHPRDERPIFFVEPQSAVRDRFPRETRIGRLLRSGDAVSPAAGGDARPGRAAAPPLADGG